MTRRLTLALLLAVVSGSAAFGQQVPNNPAVMTPRLDLGVGYNVLRTNSPPGGCDCFGLQGGFASVGVHVRSWLSGEVEVSGSHANDISPLHQDLTLFTFLAGPRISLPNHRIVPFGQALFGMGHGSDSYFPTSTSFSTSATNFAYTAGGGVDFSLSQHISYRVVNVQYLRTQFPNGGDNWESHLSIQTGLVFKFGTYWHEHRAAAAVVESHPIALACSVGGSTVQAGQTVTVFGSTDVNRKNVVYAWTTSGGFVQGNGRHVIINTTGLTAGDYTITGHAALANDPSSSGDCETIFRVAEAPSAPAPAPVPNAVMQTDEGRFHDEVPDVYFDYDKAIIRPEGQKAIDNAARYLKAHPNLHITIGGFSDERGTEQYNLVLGERRADAVRDALISDGIAADRLAVISYGKGTQVCTKQSEPCFQRNRRAAFAPVP